VARVAAGDVSALASRARRAAPGVTRASWLRREAGLARRTRLVERPRRAHDDASPAIAPVARGGTQGRHIL
jgi:hypothetical protein